MVKEKKPFMQILSEFKPIFLFLPLILLMASDDATLIVNQQLFLADFNLGSRFSLMGALAGASQIVRAFFTLGFGYFSDKYNRKNLLILTGVAWIASSFFVAISPSFELVFFWRLIASAFAGASGSVTLSLLSDFFSSENRGNSFAVWTFISTVGVAIGAGLAGIFNKVEYNYPLDVGVREIKSHG